MFLIPKIHINDAIPDGVLVGYNTVGNIVCCIEFYPNYEFLFGDEDDHDTVSEWNVSKKHARRIAMMVAWRNSDYICHGST
jgi:hypothetical protein